MLPLEGKLIVTTRPADQPDDLPDLLSSMGARVVALPMIRTRILEIEKEEINKCLEFGNYQLVIFTSKRGVSGLFRNIIRHHGKAWLPESLEIAVTGPTTAKEVEKFGYRAGYINPGTCAEDLASYLLDKVVQKGVRILHVTGNLGSGIISERLSEKAEINRLNVYETISVNELNQQEADYFRKGKVDMCIFTSPSGFYSYLEFFGNYRNIKLAAIGKTTAAAIVNAGYEVTLVSPYPSSQSLASAIEEFFINNN